MADQTTRRRRAGLSVQGVARLIKPGKHGDGHGLYLYVKPQGHKHWVLRVVSRGRRVELGLGSVRDVTLAEARVAAQRLRREVRSGGDPQVSRRRAAAVPSLQAVAVEVHAAKSSGFKNTKHRAQWLASLEPVFAALGDRPVTTISSGDVLAVLRPMWATRPETASRVLQRLRFIFQWCKAQGVLHGENPTEGLRTLFPAPKPSRHHAALPYAQAPAFLVALRASPSHSTVQAALEFLILTAARTSEVLGATWDEMDLDAATWTIPAARMKAGVVHRVPLTALGVALLEAVRAASDGRSRYVFPGRVAPRPLSTMVFLMALRRLDAPCTAHGFRTTFKTWARERTHFENELSEFALAHRLASKTEAAYNRTDLFEKRRALMEAWDHFLQARPATVVRMA